MTVNALLAVSVRSAEPNAARPEVWMVPPGGTNASCLRELFTHPEGWTESRSRITVIGCTAHHLTMTLSRIRSCNGKIYSPSWTRSRPASKY